MSARRSLNGALAGGIAAGVWALQQPLDKRVFDCGYDDVEILGKLVTRGPRWPVVGTVLHLQNGAVFGAVYALAHARAPGRWPIHALAAGLAEHVGLWPLTKLVDRYHPARREMTSLAGNRRAFAQATWRHLLFAMVLGAVEARLNARDADPPAVQSSSNGHGQIEGTLVVEETGEPSPPGRTQP